ncbi:DNA topoisomerase [Lysinibacillus sp. CNPSo 3705]|uniref:type IA DNA topoisomerase n=1 Tax=Lysinibacillus sp. CNPSo 3705 TaxID=3028148 RepID=UPI002363DE90|nr:type IA DNA topoisomerase [Lysinibacillus sp. CNPSo 3705]MDD1505318.1 DNA topoisomerase [Lysinibacillus sp. CNPSo 3705]
MTATIPNMIIISEKRNQAMDYCAAFNIAQTNKYYVLLKACSTFPFGAIVTWASGHLLELCEVFEYPGQEHLKKWSLETLPLQIEGEPLYKVKKGEEEHFKAVKNLIRQVALKGQTIDGKPPIICSAVDQDREGELIFRNLLYHCLSPKELQNVVIKKLLINSLEKSEVFKGFNNLQDDRKALMMYEEAKARSIADFLVGINASRLYSVLIQNALTSCQNNVNYTSALGGSITFGVGRVQSPTLFLAYRREQKIENFEPENFYELYGEFTSEKGVRYQGKAAVKTNSMSEIKDILQTHSLSDTNQYIGHISDIVIEEKKSMAPTLHSLMTLQTKANRLWKMSPKKTLTIVQTLYEKYKLVSYPRTSCTFITEAEFEYLLERVEGYKSVLGISFVNAYETPRKRFVNSKKVAEHYGLIPTKKIPTEEELSKLSKDELNIYLEILRTTLAMFHSDYQYEKTSITTAVNSMAFKTVCKRDINIGFKELWPKELNSDADAEKDDADSITIDGKLSINERSKCMLKVHEGTTSAPSVYTEGQLLDAMQTCGSLLDDEDSARILKEVKGIGTEATRADALEALKSNKLIEVRKNKVHVTPKGKILCFALDGTLLSSPHMTAEWESYLKSIGEGRASAITFLNQINNFINHLISTTKINFSNPQLIQSLVEEANKALKNSVYGPCPKCKKGNVIDRGNFVSCDEYKNGCEFSISKTVAKKKLSESQLKKLITKGKTSVIKGFLSGKNVVFETALTFTEDYKIQFDKSKKNK